MEIIHTPFPSLRRHHLPFADTVDIFVLASPLVMDGFRLVECTGFGYVECLFLF